MNLADRYVALKAEMDRLEKEMNEVKAELCAMAPADAAKFEIVGEVHKVSVTQAERTTIAWAKACERYMTPRQLADARRFFSSTTPYTLIKVLY